MTSIWCRIFHRAFYYRVVTPYLANYRKYRCALCGRTWNEHDKKKG